MNSPDVTVHKQAEVEEKPAVQVYGKPWREVFGPSREIGSGNSGHVFRPEDPRFRQLVVKVFDKDDPLSVFFKERHALERLSGLRQVANMVGYRDTGANFLDPSFIAKEFIEGESLEEIYTGAAPFPLRPGEQVSVEQQKVAFWLISAMEAVAACHKRGILVADFKFADFLWDTKHKRTVIIDFANAFDMNDKDHYWGQKSPGHDIQELLKVFFYKTALGQAVGMRWRGHSISPDWPSGSSISQEISQSLTNKAKELKATGSLQKLTDMIADMFNSNRKDYTVQEYLGIMKDYFGEVGLYRETASGRLMRKYPELYKQLAPVVKQYIEAPNLLNSQMDSLLQRWSPESVQLARSFVEEQYVMYYAFERGSTLQKHRRDASEFLRANPNFFGQRFKEIFGSSFPAREKQAAVLNLLVNEITLSRIAQVEVSLSIYHPNQDKTDLERMKSEVGITIETAKSRIATMAS